MNKFDLTVTEARCTVFFMNISKYIAARCTVFFMNIPKYIAARCSVFFMNIPKYSMLPKNEQ